MTGHDHNLTNPCVSGPDLESKRAKANLNLKNAVSECDIRFLIQWTLLVQYQVVVCDKNMKQYDVRLIGVHLFASSVCFD